MSSNELILELLSSDDADKIRKGARMAGEIAFKEAIPLLVKQISSANIGVQEAVDRSLRRIAGTEVVEAVIPLLRSEDAPERNVAMDILRELGETNLDPLVELLQDEDSDVRIFISDILGAVDNVVAIPALGRALLNDPEVNVRYQAAVSLGNIGSKNAASHLVKALNDEEWVQFAVIEALTKIRDEDSVAALAAALDRSTDLISSTIVDALGEMGSMKAVPLLLKKLESSPTALCNKIVKAIINILGDSSISLLGGKKSDRMRDYMESAILDEDPEVQDAAVRGLSVVGDESATRLIIDLAASLNPDTDTERISFLVDSVAKIGFNEALESAFVNTCPKQGEGCVALEVLGRLDDPRVVPLLIEEFPHNPTDMQRTIIRFLACKAERKDEDFFLSVLKEHTDGKIIRSALYYLGKNGDPEKVQDAVISMLSHEYNDVKESAMEACISLNTEKIQKHFVDLTKSSSNIDRLMGVYALGCMDFDKYLDIGKEALKDPESLIRKAAVETIGRNEELDPEQLDLIREAVKDENNEVRMAAVDVLGASQDLSVEDVLISVLEDEDYWVRVRCIEHLGNRQSRKAVNQLVKLLSCENSLVAISAIKALAKIGGEVAFRSILTLVDNPEHEIQSAAEEALAALSKKAEV